MSRPTPTQTFSPNYERSAPSSVNRSYEPTTRSSSKDRAVEPVRGFNRVTPQAPVTVQPPTATRVAPTIAPRNQQSSSAVNVTPRTDKSRASISPRGTASRTAPAIRVQPQGSNAGRVISKDSLQRVPDRNAGNTVPFKGRGDNQGRSAQRFDGRGDDSRTSYSRGDSYSRSGRDHYGNSHGYRRSYGHSGYNNHHRHGGYGYHRPYARHYYRPCYSGYVYRYPRLYRSYPYYFGVGLGFNSYYGGGYYGGYYGGYGDYYGGYGGYGGYSTVTYDTTPAPSYTTYNNTTVYESAPVQGYTQSYANPDPVQYNEQSYVQSPNVISTPQAPSQTYSAESQPGNDATLSSPSSVQETQEAAAQEYREPEAIKEGHQHFGKGEFKDAQAAFLRGVLADGKDPFARLFYGMAGVAVGDYITAATSVRAALELAPDLIAEPIDLRQFYANAEMLQSQLDGLRGWLQGRSGDVEAQLMLAYLLFATGDADGADAALYAVQSGSAVDPLVNQLRNSIVQVKENISKSTPTANQP